MPYPVPSVQYLVDLTGQYLGKVSTSYFYPNHWTWSTLQQNPVQPVEKHPGLLDVLLDDLDLADGLVRRQGRRIDVLWDAQDDVVVVGVERHDLRLQLDRHVLVVPDDFVLPTT